MSQFETASIPVASNALSLIHLLSAKVTNSNRLWVLIALIILVPVGLKAQTQSTLLILTNKKARVILDGEEKGSCEPNTPFKIVTTDGEHYAQVHLDLEGQLLDKGEVVTLEAGKQKILKLFFEEAQPATPMMDEVPIADLNFAIPGLTTVGIWDNENPGMNYPYPSHYFAFDKGDEIILNTSMTNKNGTNILEIRTYPGNVLKYSNKSFKELQNLRVKVEERSIYQLTFATNHLFDRNCLLQIKRKPAFPESIGFNPNVSKQRILTAVSVMEPSAQFLNSGSNASFMGGKSRIVLPVTLPDNTVEWYYRFSASRNKEDIENVRKNFQLFGELTKLILSATGAGSLAAGVVDIGVEQLSMPPGSDHCDIYLLSYENIQNFEAKSDENWQYILEGSRKNLKSGNVKVTCCNSGQSYLGIKNPDTYDGINVSIEVIAITSSEEYVMENK